MTPDAGNPYTPSPFARDGFSLGEITAAARRGWRTGLAVLCSAVLLAILFLSTAQPLYTAQIIITEKTSESDMSAARSALSLIGGLTGSGGGAPSQFKLFSNLVNSNALARELDRKHDMVHVIFGSQWDATTHQWERPSGFIAGIKASIKRMLNMPPWSPPDSRDLAQYLAANIELVSDKSSFMSTDVTYQLRYRNQDPKFAADFLSLVYHEADGILRQRHASELQKNVDYLQKRLQQTTEVGYREALIQLVADQEKQIMLLRSDASYAAEVVDPAVPPKFPSFPSVKLTMVLAIVLGSFLAVMASIAQGLFWPTASPFSRKTWMALKNRWARPLSSQHRADM